MGKFGSLTIAALLVLTLVGCGKGVKQIPPDKGKKLVVPAWYLDPPVDDDRLVGVASATSLDMQTAVDKAKQDGRTEIARQLELRVTGMSKRFIEETGLDDDAELLGMFTQVSRSVVSDALTGSRISKQELGRHGTGYRAYVMMEMPIGEANARFVERIRAQERLYTRFRASEAFEELDRMVEEYEQWKNDQAAGLGR
ncbi:MAG TPA: LPP20 family lipoprotein [Candidatus Polarisedimenticolaceae bacterium]|nr:LPP20 family lipoprotein [Candidatus Polarisedimenticolaceae bacterium]